MKDKIQTLTRLYVGEIKKLPNRFFQHMTACEVGFLLKEFIEDVLHIPYSKVLRLRANDITDIGFECVRKTRGHELNISSVYDILHLAYPDLKPYHIVHKPSGFFTVTENLFNLLRYNNVDMVSATRGIISDFVSSTTISTHFKTTDEFKDAYNVWLLNEKNNELKRNETLNKFKDVLSTKGKRLPCKFWKELDDIELSMIVRYVIEQELKLSYGIDLYRNLKTLNFKKYKIHILDNPFYTKSGIHITTRHRLLEFVYRGK